MPPPSMPGRGRRCRATAGIAAHIGDHPQVARQTANASRRRELPLSIATICFRTFYAPFMDSGLVSFREQTNANAFGLGVWESSISGFSEAGRSRSPIDSGSAAKRSREPDATTDRCASRITERRSFPFTRQEGPDHEYRSLSRYRRVRSGCLGSGRTSEAPCAALEMLGRSPVACGRRLCRRRGARSAGNVPAWSVRRVRRLACDRRAVPAGRFGSAPAPRGIRQRCVDEGQRTRTARASQVAATVTVFVTGARLSHGAVAESASPCLLASRRMIP